MKLNVLLVVTLFVMERVILDVSKESSVGIFKGSGLKFLKLEDSQETHYWSPLMPQLSII